MTASPLKWLSHLGVGLHTLAATSVFATQAIVWTFPLVLHLSTSMPGLVFGDNVAFLWNFWWMRTAMAKGIDFFQTSFLFAPVGVGLTLHTHTALPSFVGATAFGSLSIITAQNLTILGALFLNGFCTYLLVSELTKDRGAALIAGCIFGGSPYISAHLNGHFNLVAAWVIPLFAIAARRTLQGRWQWGALAGLVLGATMYVDYYYVIYEFTIAGCLCALAARQWSVAFRTPREARGRVETLLWWVMIADAAATLAIAAAAVLGMPLEIGRLHLGLFNALQIFWGLAAIVLWMRWRPSISAAPRSDWPRGRAAAGMFAGLTIFLLTAAPVLFHAFDLIVRSEYATQRYFWRSAPDGIDAATWLLGNPFHGLWGGWVRGVYGRLGINPIESGAWPGIAPAALAIWAIRHCWARREIRHWTAIGALFLTWALGHHLLILGRNSGMILPEAFLRYVPIVANARIPGRAMVVVFLALAMLASRAVTEWRARSRRPTMVLAGLFVLVSADYLPAPFPLVSLDRPGIYETLRDRPESGTLCELPLGTRDGFGGMGQLDPRTLFYQTIHERPIVGGFIARLPPAVVSGYRDDPLLSALLRLSEPSDDRPSMPSWPDRAAAGGFLRKNGIRFVMLNRETASGALIEYVERVLPVTLIAQEGPRALYLASEW